MKKLSLLASLVVLTMAGTAQAALLTPSQERDVMSRIDSICGDTWCEGDYNFEFRFIRCGNNGTCTVFFVMMDHNTSPSTIRLPGNIQASFRKTQAEGQCTVSNIRGYNDLVDVTAQSLTDHFYSAMTDCIAVIEKGLRR